MSALRSNSRGKLATDGAERESEGGHGGRSGREGGEWVGAPTWGGVEIRKGGVDTA